MVSRRVVIGKFADGVTYGMKVGLAGVDALAEDGNSGQLSFNSEWTDIVNVQQVGFVNGTTLGGFPGGADVLITDPGYVPYAETRRFTGGNVIWDDNIFVSNRSGLGGYWYQRAPLTLRMPTLASGETALYVILKVPVILS